MTADKTADEGPKKAPGFDDLMAELERIVERMEGGELPLEESLRLFERGTGLMKQAQQMLDTAEQRVEKLTESMKISSADDA